MAPKFSRGLTKGGPLPWPHIRSDDMSETKSPAPSAAPRPVPRSAAGDDKRSEIATIADNATKPKESGGRDGLDPTRYGDWEKAGRCIDF